MKLSPYLLKYKFLKLEAGQDVMKRSHVSSGNRDLKIAGCCDEVYGNILVSYSGARPTCGSYIIYTSFCTRPMHWTI